jgi:asparagine synthase (glutamine-hydrolysing)
MCGFTGFLDRSGALSADTLAGLVGRMNDTLFHRGPDDGDVWVDAAPGVALGHRRLSILDLSPAGHQPMPSAGGRYVVAFNGEIYNHLELRRELEAAGEAPDWRGHSDTETLLAAVAAFGVEAALRRFVGMYAFALWDRETRTLYLARDRLGEKPLYYGWQGDSFLFGSELKAFKPHPAFRAEIDRDALTLFLRHGYIPAPHTIYRGIHKLPAGAYLALTSDSREAVPVAYWSARAVAETGQRNPYAGTETEAADELERLLRRAVAGQMMADVPLGAFLSGGFDSSTVVALMQAQSSRPVRTFTIGFREKEYNEADHAAAVARHLGTEHTELYVTPEEAMAVIPKLPALYDEPFADSSQIPTFLVSQLARRHVTVSLSGDAGDELFGGYSRYRWTLDLWNRIGRLPQGARSALAGLLTLLPIPYWNRLFGTVGFALPDRLRSNPGDKLHKLAALLNARTPETVYRDMISYWKEPAGLVLGATEPRTLLTDPDFRVALDDFGHRMMYLDTESYLTDDILVKVDRAAMGVSLETRVPLLDHRVVEFAWRLPLSLKMRGGQGKWLLREVLYRYVPQSLMDRPKMGFGVPTDHWLRGPLKDWAEALLDEERLRREGFFDPAPIREKWAEHQSGRRNWSYHLWIVLMFQAWLEAQS